MRQATAALTHAGAGIACLDADARVTYVNEALLEIVRTTRSTVLGRRAWEIVHTFDETGELVPGDRWPVWSVMSEGTEILGKVMMKRMDGSVFRASYRITPMRREGAVVGAVVVLSEA